jgi:hypothetical protein
VRARRIRKFETSELSAACLLLNQKDRLVAVSPKSDQVF